MRTPIYRELMLFAATAVALGALGCDGGRGDAWQRSRAVIGPVPLKSGVAYVDGARDQIVVVDAGAQVTVRATRLGRHPIFAAPTPDREHVVVITRGHEAYKKGEVDEAPGLYLVAAAAPEAAVRYEIGSPFDRLAVAADGSVAVAYFSEGGPDEEGLFRNPNELAIIDLQQPPGEQNPVLRTVRSFGAAPLGVVLSPPMGIPGDPEAQLRTLAFVLAPNTITILDATNPERREVSVRLTLGAALVTPRELAFAPGAGAAYLRAEGASDVLQILLSYEEPSPEQANDNDFQPALAELGAGGTPADVAVYDDLLGVRRVLAATPGTREVTVIDADTAEFLSIDTGDPVDRILLLPPEAPRIAVLASVATRSPRVHLLDLQHIGQELTPPQMTTMTLAEPIFDVVAVPGQTLVMVVHDDARTVLGLLDVATATVAPLEGAGRLDSYDFASGGAYLVGATQSVARVGIVDLSNLHPEDVRLDQLPGSVFALDSGAVYIDHADPFGLATILPSPAAGRDEAVVVSGFMLTGLLDEEL